MTIKQVLTDRLMALDCSKVEIGMVHIDGRVVNRVDRLFEVEVWFGDDPMCPSPASTFVPDIYHPSTMGWIVKWYIEALGFARWGAVNWDPALLISGLEGAQTGGLE